MSGVWVFNNKGVMHLVDNPYQAAGAESAAEGGSGGGNQQQRIRKKALVHLPTGEVVNSYGKLEGMLMKLGWERYYGGDSENLLQFHKTCSIDLISLPKDFSRFNSVYMYDIVVKNPNMFHVRDT